MCHYDPLEMPFPLVSFLAGIIIFRFWPNTMDYSQVFSSNSSCTHNSPLEGATELKFALKMPFPLVSFLAGIRFWQKTMAFSQAF